MSYTPALYSKLNRLGYNIIPKLYGLFGMLFLKRFVGVICLLIAIAFLAVAFGSSGTDSTSRSILDSPEASGRLLGIMIPVSLFGVIGLWLLFAKKPTN
jgi:hypothetical protein